MVALMGIASAVSRLVFGRLGDKSPAHRAYTGAVMVFLTGLVTAQMPFFTTYPLMVMQAVMFGFGSGCFLSLRPVIVVDTVGVERIETAVGFSFAMVSFAVLFCSPLAGLMIENSSGTDYPDGNFNTPFMIVGLICMLSSFLLVCVHLLNIKKSKTLTSP